jgi:hypothetical protein
MLAFCRASAQWSHAPPEVLEPDAPVELDDDVPAPVPVDDPLLVELLAPPGPDVPPPWTEEPHAAAKERTSPAATAAAPRKKEGGVLFIGNASLERETGSPAWSRTEFVRP